MLRRRPFYDRSSPGTAPAGDHIINKQLPVYFWNDKIYIYIYIFVMIKYVCFKAVDLHSFLADPDPAVFLNADPDPA